MLADERFVANAPADVVRPSERSSRATGGARCPRRLTWIASLSPWPEEFGLGRMRALLERLGDPQRGFDAIHVVGTNGKSTATRTIAALLARGGAAVGRLHLAARQRAGPSGSGSTEPRRTSNRPSPASAGRRRSVGATQFETLTAAAFAEFAVQGVEVAAVEAGLGGRLDATNVVAAPVVLLTNVTHEHTDVLGETPEEIAREKLAVAHAARVVVLPDNTFAHLVPRSEVRLGGAREAAEAYLGTPVAEHVEVRLPGRLERRNGLTLDGAHTPEAADWLLSHLSGDDYVLCVSILGDKDVDGDPRAPRARRSHARGHPELERSCPRREGTRPPRRTVLRACRNRC